MCIYTNIYRERLRGEDFLPIWFYITSYIMTLKLLNKNCSQKGMQNIFIVVNCKNIAFIKVERKGFWKSLKETGDFEWFEKLNLLIK